MGATTSKAKGKIVKKHGSRKLYCDFFYLGKRIERSLGLDDTSEGHKKADAWLEKVLTNINAGTFKFAEAFPGASEKEKDYFTRLEGWIYKPAPEQIKFGDFLDSWIKTDLAQMPHTTRVDYYSSINPWIRPFFSECTFFQINRSIVDRFIRGLVHKQTEEEIKVGIAPEPFGEKRIDNILAHLRHIWERACRDNHWELPSPFPPPKKRTTTSYQGERPAGEITSIVITEEDLRHNAARELEADRLPLRFEEWVRVYEHLDPWCRPIAVLMLLTGMIPSELAGICEGHLVKGYIHVRQVVSRGMLYKRTKTAYRDRDIRITQHIQTALDAIKGRSTGPFFITRESGKHFDHRFFWGKWSKAIKAAGIDYRVPYCLRHTFTAWCLCIGTDMNKLVDLLGHGSKEMVYNVYGKYVQGLEVDKEKILDFFGEDFLCPSSNEIAPNSAKVPAKEGGFFHTST